MDFVPCCNSGCGWVVGASRLRADSVDDGEVLYMRVAKPFLFVERLERKYLKCHRSPQ